LPDFWDTSGLAKLYIPERGSAWASERARGGLAASEFCVVEIASVLQRRFTEGQSSADERDERYARFLSDTRAFDLITVREQIVTHAARLLLQGAFAGRTRALDAVQLASALEWFERTAASNMEAGAFIVADRSLREAAVALGLAVEDPEDYE